MPRVCLHRVSVASDADEPLLTHAAQPAVVEARAQAPAPAPTLQARPTEPQLPHSRAVLLPSGCIRDILPAQDAGVPPTMSHQQQHCEPAAAAGESNCCLGAGAAAGHFRVASPACCALARRLMRQTSLGEVLEQILAQPSLSAAEWCVRHAVKPAPLLPPGDHPLHVLLAKGLT